MRFVIVPTVGLIISSVMPRRTLSGARQSVQVVNIRTFAPERSAPADLKKVANGFDPSIWRAILFRWPLATVGASDQLHHGGKTANPSWLYSWAWPRAVVVSQRPPAPGTTDALAPLEHAGTPVLRTWQRGAIHFRWTSDGIVTQGFLDPHDQPGSRHPAGEK